MDDIIEDQEYDDEEEEEEDQDDDLYGNSEADSYDYDAN